MKGRKIVKWLQYSVYKRETGNASGKAKRDAYDILLKIGFEATYNPSKYRPIRIIQQLISIFRLKKYSNLIIQYPTISSSLMKILENKLSKLSLSIALIHDLPSIQGTGGDSESEIKCLSHFDCLIVHNSSMKKYVCQHGYKGKIIELELFDYLHDFRLPVIESKHDGKICIAGNLDKSRYICDLDKVNRCIFNLYGINKTLNLTNIKNVEYKGLLSSEEIVYKLDGDYGLVWDGDSIKECSGICGKYLLYNSPHKLSLYIASGKPIITWKKAAIAEFVEKENIGITIDSLLELNDIDLTKNYDIMKVNVMKLKQRVATGYYLKKAINEVFEAK